MRPPLAFLAFALSPPFVMAATWMPPSASYGTEVTNGTAPNPQWSSLLGSLLYFYDQQRSGALSQPPSSNSSLPGWDYSNRVAWRNDTLPNDGQDVGLDLSGGYFDAGDYVKATYPLAWSWFSIAWSALAYGAGFDAASQSAYLDTQLRWGLDWMIRAHPSPNTLAVFVGNSSSDAAYWGGDQDIPTDRPTYVINETYPGTDVAAQTAAAFAIASMLYSGDSLNVTSSYARPAGLQVNTTYANLLLTHARQLYDFAQQANQQTYTEAVPAAASAYPSYSYADDLVLAGLSLALATNTSMYFDEAVQTYANHSLSRSSRPVNWASKIGLAYVMMAETALARPGLASNLTGWQNETEAYLDGVITHQLTSAGLLYYDGDSDDASLNPALNAAMLLLRYAPIATTNARHLAYTSFAQSQLAYALGKNPSNSPYVVGVHPNSPRNPSSAFASGGNNISAINTSPANETYVLYGAVIGGPDRKDNFYDLRDDYPQTEPALDYNPPLIAIAAWAVSDTTDPYYTGLQGSATFAQGQPCDAAYPCGGGKHGLSAGAIAGIVIGVLVALAIAIGLIVWLIRRRPKRFGVWDR